MSSATTATYYSNGNRHVNSFTEISYEPDSNLDIKDYECHLPLITSSIININVISITINIVIIIDTGTIDVPSLM